MGSRCLAQPHRRQALACLHSRRCTHSPAATSRDIIDRGRVPGWLPRRPSFYRCRLPREQIAHTLTVASSLASCTPIGADLVVLGEKTSRNEANNGIGISASCAPHADRAQAHRLKAQLQDPTPNPPLGAVLFLQYQYFQTASIDSFFISL